MTSHMTGASVDAAGPGAVKVCVCVCAGMHALFELFAVFTHNSVIVRVCHALGEPASTISSW